MESKFDYKTFKAQHELQTAIVKLTSTLREATNNANQRIFPQRDGQPAPFEELLRQLRINPNRAEEQPFDFELVGVTLDEIVRHCDTNNLDFMTFTQNRGNRLFYNRGYNQQHPHWTEVCRPQQHWTGRSA